MDWQIFKFLDNIVDFFKSAGGQGNHHIGHLHASDLIANLIERTQYLRKILTFMKIVIEKSG